MTAWVVGVTGMFDQQEQRYIRKCLKRPICRTFEFSGVLRTWIKRAGCIFSFIYPIITFLFEKQSRRLTRHKRSRPRSRWRYINGRLRRHGRTDLTRAWAVSFALSRAQAMGLSGHEAACMSSTSNSHHVPFSQRGRFDTDSQIIHINNHASWCITNTKQDFISTLKPINLCIRGYHGTGGSQ